MQFHPPLYILRHGETVWNAEGRLQGRYDSPLTERGIAQAHAQRKILDGLDLDGFTAFSSPQGRAFQTAAIALGGRVSDIRTDDRLSEIGLGAFAGHDRAALIAQEQVSDGFALYERAPEGEGFAALQARCEQFLMNLTGPAILVTHGITSRMLRLVLTGRDMADLPEMGGGQGVIYEVRDAVQTCLREKGLKPAPTMR